MFFKRTHLRMVLAPLEKPMNVRPKLFQFVTGDIHQNLRAQNVGAAPDRMRAGVVGIGETGGHAIAQKFGKSDHDKLRDLHVNVSVQAG